MQCLPVKFSGATSSLSSVIPYYYTECFYVLPQCVEYFSIVPDAQQLIGCCYPVRVGSLGIPKDGVRQPDQADHIAG